MNEGKVRAGIHTEYFVEKFMGVDYPCMDVPEVQGAYVAGTILEAGMGKNSDPIPKLIVLTKWDQIQLNYRSTA